MVQSQCLLKMAGRVEEGSAGKGICLKTGVFIPQDLHGGRTELTPASCSLTSTCYIFIDLFFCG